MSTVFYRLLSALLGCATFACATLACQAPPNQLSQSRVDAPPSPSPDASPPDSSGSGLPDLALDVGRTRVTLAIEERFFAVDACELNPDEDCITAPGMRRLLRFSVETPNLGDADIVVGPPDHTNSAFQWSDCHGHFHYIGFAEYELLDEGGQAVLTGQKQAYCLVDTRRYVDDDPTVSTESAYHCEDQGIQRGWSDVYESDVPCQHFDITDLPDGDYTLRVHINRPETVTESNYANNLLELAVTLGAPGLTSPTEPCPDVGARSTGHLARECGWTLTDTWPCTPGRRMSIGCAPACSLGYCSGDPLLRVCDSNRPDGNCTHASALGKGDNACGSECPRIDGIPCPASGSIDIYTAPLIPGEPYSCQPALLYSP